MNKTLLYGLICKKGSNIASYNHNIEFKVVVMKEVVIHINFIYSRQMKSKVFIPWDTRILIMYNFKGFKPKAAQTTSLFLCDRTQI